MSAVEVLEGLGGVATWSALSRRCSQAEIRRLVASGDLVLDARWPVRTASSRRSLRTAARLSAALSHRSAAQFHGWEQKSPPLDRHGSRRALVRDARRYNSFVVAGWLVLRFSWEDVMHHPDDVLRVLEAVASRERTYCPCCGSGHPGDVRSEGR